MKRILATLAVMALAAPVAAWAETWEKPSLIDNMCKAKFESHPDDHPTSCLLKCAGSGYGVVTANGKWLKLDKAGNDKAVAALKATSRKDHIKVDVSGDLKGDTIAVASLTIPD